MMRNILKRITALFLMAVFLIGLAPAGLLDDLLSASAETGYLELNDGYLSVKVSKSNGGFLVDTAEGDKLNKSDNNKFLLYPDENYDTSFTSFRVKRGGTVSEYVFGRDYSYKGITTGAVTVAKVDDTTIAASWTVDGIKFVQQVALLAVDSYQHGMVYVTVTAENIEGEAIEEIKARVLMDTALGYQDYAVYMAGQADGSYTGIKTEQTLTGSEYSNYFFAYDDEMSPSITAYTVNATIGGVTVVPEKVTFAHWNNLASTVFDYQTGEDPKETLNFTNPYNKEYLTADSAFALYYDMGSAAANAGSTKSVGFYYGVYSNVSAEPGSVAVNFIGPASMELVDNGYADINGDVDGNMSLAVKVQNTAEKDLDTLAIAFYPESGMTSYDTMGNLNLTATVADPYYVFLTDLRPGETRDVNLNLAVDPSDVTEYRRIGVKIFDVSHKMDSLGELHLMDEDLIFEKETYVLCPSVDGGVLSFVSTTPEMVYSSGTRSVFIAGKNFGLLRDSTQYRVVLRPLDGGRDKVIPSENFIVNTEDNTANVIIEETLPIGTWQIIFDWVDAAMSDTTSDALRFVVTNKVEYISGNFGVIGMRRTGEGNDVLPWSYELVLGRDEADYQSKIAGVSMKDIIYELRGDFAISTHEDGRIDKLEAVARKNGDAIVISNSIQVTEGRVTVSLEYDEDGNQTAINTDIDGKVYTVGANTKVWDGVCAITSLEEGDLVKLPIYKYDGTESPFVEDAVANTNFVSLMWPGGASSMQTLAGMLLELRYCHFALMASVPGSTNPDTRVVTFGAQLDPSFLVPTTYDWGIIEPSPAEEAELNLANTDYTSNQLRDLDEEYGEDKMKWYEAQGGTLALYIHNIFFGGKFIGINTSIEVGLPSYTDGMPEIGGTLDLMIMNGEWGIGIEGEADIEVLTMEAELRLRSYNGIPVPDKIRFHVGGNLPGIPIDPFGVFWVRGMGAGIDKIYETYFVSSTIPPLTLILSGEFALFDVLTARGDVTLSGRGISAYLSNIGVAGISIIDKLGGSVYWYPRLNMRFSIDLSILGIIYGSGAIALQEVPTGFEDDTEFFWEGFATAGIKLPDLLGGFEIASADLGVNNNMIWGAIHVIKLDAGVTYHWGGDVEFAFGKYDAPEATLTPLALRSIPVYTDPSNGRTLYATALTNAKLIETTLSVDDTVISSDAEKRTHSFVIVENDDENAMLVLTMPVESETEAMALKSELAISIGGESYDLVWVDNSKTADAAENANANAMLGYNSETGYVTATISFTDATSFDKEIVVKTPTASELALYGVEKMASIDSVTLSDDGTTAAISGAKLEKLDSVSIYAVDEIGNAYLLGTAEGGYDSIAISYPSELQSGTYILKAVGSQLDENGEGLACPSAEAELIYVNPNQPDATTSVNATLGGDYTLDVEIEAVDGAEGYYVNIYEQAADGTLSSTMFTGMKVEGESFTVGGRYDSISDDGETVTTVGLNAGSNYVVAVSAYVTAEDGGMILSEETLSQAVTMVAPTATDVTISLENGIGLSAGYGDVTIDAVASSAPTLIVSGIEGGKGSYRINGGEVIEWNGGNISFTELEDGIYTVSLSGENSTKDSFGTIYQFMVDTTAPSLMLSTPVNGSFFEDTVTVSGISEAGATITVTANGSEVTTVADNNGSFSAVISLDSDKAYQRLSVVAEDALGNSTDSYNLTLTNKLIGNPDAKAVLVSDGEVITKLGATEGKQLSMALAVGDKLVILEGGAMGSMVDYSVDVKKGSANVDASGVITIAEGTLGIVVASLGNYQAAAIFTSNDFADATVTLDIPEGGFVYDESKKTPAVLSVVIGDEEVSTDAYDVSYSANVAAGMAVATITAKEGSGYIGKVEIPFHINPAPISNVGLDVTAPVRGENAQTTVTVPTDCANASISWTVNGESFEGTYAADTTYTATVTLSPVANHAFAEDITCDSWTVTLNDDGTLTLTRDYYVPLITYTVTFMADGEVVAKKTVNEGDALTDIPEVPVKDGHNQTAPTWDVVDFSCIMSDLTVNAVYIRNTYTVSFMAEGELVATKTVIHGDTLSDIPEVPEKEGYTQTAPTWDVTNFNNVMSDMTVNAVYTINTYTVSFIADGVVVATKTVNHGDTLIDIPAIPDKIGHDQTAPTWSLTDFTNIISDLTVNAVYTRNVYVVSFMVDGVEVNSIRMEYGQSLAGAAFPAVPDRENYDGAWDKTSVDSISSDVVINAVYTKNYLLGDANNDGVVDNLDAVYILRYDASLIGDEDIRFVAADVNKDGIVDNLDAVLVLKYTAGLIDSLE